MNVPVPATIDLIQEVEGNLEVPEIRVWCHPHKINKSGDDFYQKFYSFKEAIHFVEIRPEAERSILIAFRGYEFDLFQTKPYLKPKEVK